MIKTPRHHFKFQAFLVEKVRAETKRCTIRAARIRLPRVGDIAVLECWAGLPYRSGVEHIADAVLTKVTPIRIEPWDGRKEGIKVVLDGVELIGWEIDALARDDGFETFADFAEFFRSRLPFSGHFYEWETP